MRALASLFVAAVVLALVATPARSFARETPTIARAQQAAVAPPLDAAPAPLLIVSAVPLVVPTARTLAPVAAPAPSSAPLYLQKRALLL
jgi:hypothetical protein